MGKFLRRLRGFKIETEPKIHIIKKPIAFISWKDAIPYLGKPIVVRFVESPDLKGNLEGIHLVMTGNKIITALLEVKGRKFECYKCYPDN